MTLNPKSPFHCATNSGNGDWVVGPTSWLKYMYKSHPSWKFWDLTEYFKITKKSILLGIFEAFWEKMKERGKYTLYSIYSVTRVKEEEIKILTSCNCFDDQENGESP